MTRSNRALVAAAAMFASMLVLGAVALEQQALAALVQVTASGWLVMVLIGICSGFGYFL